MQENTGKQEPKVSGPEASSAGPTNATPEVKEELSKVGANPKRNILVIASMGLGFAVMAYNLLAPIFFSNKHADDVPTPAPQTISSPSTVSSDIPPVPQVPEPPKLVDPTPPPPPPPPLPSAPEAPTLPTASVSPTASPAAVELPAARSTSILSSDDKSADAVKARAEAKRKSSIVLVGGSPQKETTAIEKDQANDFKKRGPLEYVLGQGKLIDAVLETAINSDLQGEVRAVISRDVYAENGNTILIPKGTRVFGKASPEATTGRVTVKWNKINLESGYTLTISADGVDNLGRQGVQGRVDNKITEQMTNAILTSAFNVGVATGLDKLVPPVTSTATASQAASSVTSIATQAAAIAADPNNETPPNYAVVGTDAGAGAKITAICNLKPLITDTTSTTYTQFGTACTTASTALATSPSIALTNLVATITGLGATSAQAAVANATPTQAQQASQQAFKDVTTAAKTAIGQVTFKPTVTVDQGTKIKIYVNKDYVFPKDAINQLRVIH